MTWRVVIEPDAKLELSREVETYGEQLLDEVEAVRDWLRRMPMRYPAWPLDPNYRRAVIVGLPFVVVFRIDEPRHAVVIVALAPTKREPGYWRTR